MCLFLDVKPSLAGGVGTSRTFCKSQTVAKCHTYGRYICVKILEGLGKKCWRPHRFGRLSSFGLNSTNFDVVLYIFKPAIFDTVYPKK